MMNKIKTLIVAVATMLAAFGGNALLVSQGAMAVGPAYVLADGTNTSSTTTSTTYDKYINEVNDGNETELMGKVKDVINVILGIVGLVAVIMIIIGGINFIISQGEAAKVTKARNTILYGVIGLFVALLAFAIVNFVLSNVFNG